MELDTYSDTLMQPRRVQRLRAVETILERFSSSERLALYVFSILLAASALAIVAGLNAAVSVTVPSRGGSLVEGEIGPARFINPVLATSQADEDLTELVYSGLMRATPSGTYITDLASSYDISPDGKTYTFHLRRGAEFHDGVGVTSADVLYTVSLAQHPEIKSPRRADWEGVSVAAPDTHTVVFTLPHPYAPFLENATLGILPKHIWQDVSPEEFPFTPANTRPVGSGPYRVTDLQTDNTGSATRYELAPFSKYVLGKPYLKRITMLFFPNQSAMVAALNAGRIDAIAAMNPEDLTSIKRNDLMVVSAPLPRVFGVFLNQGRAPALSDASARAALDAAIDRQAIIDQALGGFATALNGPIPPGLGADPAPAVSQRILELDAPATTTASAAQSRSLETKASNARSILARGGWKFDDATKTWKKGKLVLQFALATANEPELVAAANAVAKQWQAAGIPVSVQVYPISELNANVIRPRAYDAILFGEVVGRTGDLFAFWHSSQRNDPGLNLALYANSKADSLLAQARSTTDPEQRRKLHEQFAAVVKSDQPAIFLFSPKFLYVAPSGLHGIELGALTTPAERFLTAHQWYTDTERVWSVFTNQ